MAEEFTQNSESSEVEKEENTEKIADKKDITAENLAEQVSIETKKIEQAPEKLIQESEKRLQGIIERAGLPPKEIEKLKKETAVDERLAQNQSQAERLTKKTLDSIKDLVEILGEGVSQEEKETLFEKSGIGKTPLGKGAFYDAYEINKTNLVFKELKLNYLFGPEEAVKMLARHEIEAGRLKEYFGEEFIPEFCFVYPEKHKELFEKEKGEMGSEKAKLYNISTFVKIQTDRRLQKGFRKRDVEDELGVSDKIFQKAGELLGKSGFFRKEAAGAMIEEKVMGITFAECAQKFNSNNCPNWDKLRENVVLFLEKLGKFNDKYSLLWHRLDSDNVMVETDDNGDPTGGIKILDLNFTERASEGMRKLTVRKTEKSICEPLKKIFGIK